MDIGYSASLLENNGHKTSLIDTALKKFELDQLVKLIKKQEGSIIFML